MGRLKEKLDAIRDETEKLDNEFREIFYNVSFIYENYEVNEFFKFCKLKENKCLISMQK